MLILSETKGKTRERKNKGRQKFVDILNIANFQFSRNEQSRNRKIANCNAQERRV